MPQAEKFKLSSETLGALPIVNHFLTRMGVAGHLDAYLPNNDARLRLAPAVVIAAVVRNIIISHRPVYALGEWATPYAPELLGLGTADATALNDDRVGRMLDRLFDADRATMITEAALGVIANFDIDVSQLHNDSTTVTLTGAYLDADGHARGAKATPAVRYGHNKDFRPDLLTELVTVFSLVRASRWVGRWVRVLAHGHRQRRGAQGSPDPDGAIRGIVDLDRRPLRALSAA